MKLGKHITLKEYKNVRLSYGTVNQNELKSIYLEMDSWVSPLNKIDYDDTIYKTKKSIKNRIRSEKNELFKKESIVDIDIKTNSIKEGKRSFMNIQITLYTNSNFDIKSKEIKKYLQSLMEDIINFDLSDKNIYLFHKTKE